MRRDGFRPLRRPRGRRYSWRVDETTTLSDHAFGRKLRVTTYSPVLSLGLLAIGLIALVAYLLYTMRWVDHTNRVIEKGLYTEKLLLDLQSASRGFFLTGDASLLKPYGDSAGGLPETLGELYEMVSDNPEQSALLERISNDTRQWLLWAGAQVRDANERGAVPSASEVRASGEQFEHVQEDLETFLKNEYTLRDARSAQARRAGYAALGGAAVLTLIVAWIQCRMIQTRLAAIRDTYREALRLAKERRLRVQELLLDLDQEFQAVGEIQRSLLPVELPAMHGVEVAASYTTSRRAGGDYYDFFPLPPARPDDDRPRYGILIADVSGHGTPAAVLMAVTHSIAHGFDRPEQAPHELLAFVNRRLCESYTSNHTAFVTAFYAVYDPAARTLNYSSAGHNPPRLRRGGAGEPFEALDDAQGLPLGVSIDEQYVTKQRTLRPDDTLVLYTDGITEARNAGGEFLNVEGLDAAVAEHSTPDEMLVAALQAVQDLAGENVQDDRTLVILRVCESDAGAENGCAAPRHSLVTEAAAADPITALRA